MAALFPDEYFNSGGDEVDGNYWDKNPCIQTWMQTHKFKRQSRITGLLQSAHTNHYKKTEEACGGLGRDPISELPKRHFDSIMAWRRADIASRADGRTDLLEWDGPLLDAIEGAEFELGELILEPGDTLVAYSDGVLECRNTSEEEFGLDRILVTLRHAESPSAQATLMMLLAALQDFANGSPLSDDVSLTVIQREAKCRHPIALAG